MNLKKVRTLIVEDDKETLEYLKKLVRQHNQLELVDEASDKCMAPQKFRLAQPDLVLLDIELGQENAFDLLDEIETKSFHLIFVTGHSEYLLQAVEYYAFYFLIKPFDKQKFDGIIDAFVQKANLFYDQSKLEYLSSFVRNQDSQFFLNTGLDFLAIDLNDVLYCNSEGNFTTFYFKEGRPELGSNNLKFYENLLRRRGFFRANRFHLINITNIEAILKKETLVMKDGTKISISNRNKARLKEIIDVLNG